jgi:spore maturation protein A
MVFGWHIIKIIYYNVLGDIVSKIWSVIIIISVLLLLFSGEANNVLSTITNSSYKSIENILVILSTMCFWSGMFNVLKHTSLLSYISKILKPVILLLFGKNISDESIENISLNMSANLIGVGNAGTLYAIKSMESLQKENDNPDGMSNNMMLFLFINTTSIQLIPTNILSYRILYGSVTPNAIILPNLIISFGACIIGICLIKIISKVGKR